MDIISDNRAIEKNLRALEKAITDHGGYIDPDLSIKCENGGLSVFKNGFARPPGSPLIALPCELLIPTDQMGISAKKDELHFNPEKGALTDTQRRMADTMIELYNLTDKIALHKKSCCWFTFQGEKELLGRLLAARTLNPALNKYLDFINNPAAGNFDQIACDSFIKTRTINHKYMSAEKTAEEDGAEAAQPRNTADIMPIVDFMNHNTSGSFFSFRKDFDATRPGYEYLLVGDARPMPDNNECFAFYNQMDAIDSFIGYGFPYAQAPYVRSIPVEFEVPKTGVIKVHSTLSAMHKGKLSPSAAGLRPYIPHALKNNKDSYELSHLLIPTNSSAPQALRRVLRLLITNRVAASRALTVKQIWDCVLEAERKIIDANITFYKDLLAHLDGLAQKNGGVLTEPAATLRYIAALQLTKLYKYSFDESQPAGGAVNENPGETPRQVAAAE